MADVYVDSRTAESQSFQAELESAYFAGPLIVAPVSDNIFINDPGVPGEPIDVYVKG